MFGRFGILFVTWACSETVMLETRVFREEPLLSNLTTSDGYIDQVTARTEIQCGQQCLSQEQCRAFTFVGISVTCRLLNHTILPLTSSAVTMENAKYYESFSLSVVCPPLNETVRTVVLSDGSLFTYVIDSAQLNYTDAEAFCNSVHGGSLVRVTTPAKFEYLVNILTFCPEYEFFGHVHIDGTNSVATDFNDVSQWETSAGATLPIQYWYPGQPNWPDTKHCARMSSDQGWRFTTADCHYLHHAACELEQMRPH